MHSIPNSKIKFRTVKLFLLALVLAIPLAAKDERGAASLELSRPVRTWEFLPVVGTRAGLLGNEAGTFEAWVYPLKLLRNFHLNFLVSGQSVPAESLARTLIIRPESATIVYSSDTFSVRETLCVPVREAGAVLTFEVDTAQAMEIEAAFDKDFQLEWPAGLGATYLSWEAALHAFAFGEETRKWVGLVGSPSATEFRQEYFANYSSSRENAFRLGTTNKGSETKIIVIAASSQGRQEAEKTYQRLVSSSADLQRESADYYRDYLERTVNLELPDKELQQAYDWSRVSMVQGLVTNTDLGTGLIAGYRASGDGQRPGFAWFFGRDSMWTSLALTASGDFANARTAIDFLSKYQRADGKITHEIAQSANLVPWFTGYPYAFASADATPLFIIATDDYVTRSGDVKFAEEKWDALWKAYQFLHSTYGSGDYPQNIGIGHGWVEGGPLLPVKAEFYQVGLGAEALRDLSHLAKVMGKQQESDALAQAFAQQQKILNDLFWAADKKFFGFAVDTKGQRVDVPSVLTTVPMWFGLTEQEKTQNTVDVLSGADHQADWGMRIISSRDPRYDPSGYHFGSVWPLFTGWAAVGEYRYHRAFPAYSNLRANALLALDGSLGHVTEVLSGDYNQPLSTASPHQIWSAAMVVSPILRGMLGLEVDAKQHRLTFSPHVPADWTLFRVNNLKVGEVRLDLTYRKTNDGITLEVQRAGAGDCTMDFAPALSLRARVVRATLDGRMLATHTDENGVDEHVTVHFASEKLSSTIKIDTRNDFGLALNAALPPLGSPSRGLRITSESWDASRNTLTLEASGPAGSLQDLAIWGASEIASAEGAAVVRRGQGESNLHITFPPGEPGSYVRQPVVIHFVPRARR